MPLHTAPPLHCLQVELSRRLLDTITRKDIHAVCRHFNWPRDCVVRISRPEVGIVDQVSQHLHSLTNPNSIQYFTYK